MKRTWLVIPLLLALAVAGGAQSLEITAQPAEPDGFVQEGEYAWTQPFQTITLHLSRTSGRLFAAVEAQAEGWVGIGFGSDLMSDAHIFIGFVRGGRAELQQHRGRGHSHRELRDAVEVDYALREEGGVTVMELSVPAEAFIGPGQGQLELIIACGKGDRTSVYHSYRRGLVIDL